MDLWLYGLTCTFTEGQDSGKIGGGLARGDGLQLQWEPCEEPLPKIVDVFENIQTGGFGHHAIVRRDEDGGFGDCIFEEPCGEEEFCIATAVDLQSGRSVQSVRHLNNRAYECSSVKAKNERVSAR